MFKLTPITNEEKPSVALTTDSFITETYNTENESAYQNEYDFSVSNIQDSPSEINYSETVTIECAGRFEPDYLEAGSLAFVALNENREIIYADFEPSSDEGVTKTYNDYWAVLSALKWARSLPGGTKILVATDAKTVVEPCPLNCECCDCECFDSELLVTLKRDLFDSMEGLCLTSISLISEENNKAADFARFALEKSIRELEEEEARYENEEDYE